MKLLIISLSFLKDRRNHIESIVLNSGIEDYSFIDAVDGINNDLTQDNQYSALEAKEYSGRHLSSSEIAISLSHKKAYEYIVNNNIDKALIIEDDVIFDNNIKDYISFVDDDRNGDIFFFSHRGDARPSYWHRTKIKNRLFAPIIDKPYGTQAYAVTKSGASSLLLNVNHVKMPADHLTGSYKDWGLRGFGFFPQVIFEEKSFSSTTLDNRSLITKKKKGKKIKHMIGSLIKPLIITR